MATAVDPCIVGKEPFILLLPLGFALNEVLVFVTVVDPTHGFSCQQASSVVLHLLVAINAFSLVVLSLQIHEAFRDLDQV